MKKILAVISVIAIMLSFASCGGNGGGTTTTTADITTTTQAETTTEEATTEDNVSGEATRYLYNGFIINLPAGFVVDDSDEEMIMAMPEEYPESADSMILQVTTKEDFGDSSKEGLEAQLGLVFDEEVFKGIDEYNEFTIDEYDAISFSYEMDLDGIVIAQKMVAIFVSDEEVVTFTVTIADGTYESELDEALSSIEAL